MKRLVAAGYSLVFQLARSFRAEECGPHHEPEFTMLEWYRAHAPLTQLASDCEDLLRLAARCAGVFPEIPVPTSRRRPGSPAVLRVDGPFERTTVAELFERHAGMILRGDESATQLREKIRQAGHDPGTAASWDDLFFQIWLDRIEPHLGLIQPTFVFDWPAPLAALARRKAGAPHLAERFELYAAGLELANAFGELTDPVEQRARFTEECAVRAARGRDIYPLDEHLLTALAHMPPTSGIAVGFDRLVMLVLGATEIREVFAFASDEV